MKDFLTSELCRAFLNHQFKQYGHVNTLKIDSGARVVTLCAELKGEVAPLQAAVSYTLEESGGQLWFIPRHLECSREWLTLAAGQLLKNKSLRVAVPPGIAANLIKLLKL